MYHGRPVASLRSALSSTWQRYAHCARREVDAAWLAAFRMLFGVTLAVSMLRFLFYGWVDRLYLQPRFHFKYWGFEFVQVLPGPWMYGVFWGLFGCACCVAVGLCYRIAAPLLALGLCYVQLIDVATYLNHYYLAALLALLLAVAPAARMLAVDACISRWLFRRAGQESVPVLYLWIFRLQVGVVYFGAALAKLQGDWLLYAQPLRIWLSERTDLAVLGPLLMLPQAPLLLSWAGFLFDATVVLFLLNAKTRLPAYCVLLVFHTLTRLLFPIGMFPVIMSVAALVFFSPGYPRSLVRFVGRVMGRQENKLRTEPAQERSLGVHGRQFAGFQVWLALLSLYGLLQVLLPLRHLAYPGNVLWHEQGMRFSWRVMVRAKGGSTEFRVRFADSADEFEVAPRRYLTPMQEAEMAGQPDLILQLAHHIAKDLRRPGQGPVQVRALTHVVLNGRRGVPLIDPSIDLSQISDGFGRASWVAPAPSVVPPYTRTVR